MKQLKLSEEFTVHAAIEQKSKPRKWKTETQTHDVAAVVDVEKQHAFKPFNHN